MARITKAPKDWGPGEMKVLSVEGQDLLGARLLISVLAMSTGQVVTWPDRNNLVGIDSEDVERLVAVVRMTLESFVRQQG